MCLVTQIALQTKITHTKQKKESTEKKLEDQVRSETKKTKFHSNIVFNTIVALLIAITPYLFQLYEYAPEADKWETAFFTIDSRNYIEVKTFIWVVLNKAIPLLLMIIWFFTCNKWWYHVILIPMFMFGFQLFGAIENKSSILDVVEIYWLIPIMMIIIPFVYFIRIRLMDKLVYGIDLKKIDAELEEYKRKEKEQQNLVSETQKQ